MPNPTTKPTIATSPTGSPAESASESLSSAASAATSVAGAAKDEATGVASAAADQAKEVATQAKEQVRTVTVSATDSARKALQQTLAEGRSQADQRARQAAEGLRARSDQLAALADGRAKDAGDVGEYVRQAADKVAEFAEHLDEGGVEGLLNDVGRFARRRPGVFLAGAAAAGFLVGRLLRNQGDDAGSETDARPEAGGGPAHRVGASAAPETTDQPSPGLASVRDRSSAGADPEDVGGDAASSAGH